MQQTLIERIKEGDRSTLELIYSQHRPEFIAWVRSRFSISEADAEDLFQSAIICIYNKLYSGTLSTLHCKFKTYLYAVGKQLALNHCRKQRRMHNKHKQCYSGITAYHKHSSDLNTTDNSAKMIYSALNKLQDPCRSIIELFYFEGKSMTEIGELLGYKNANCVKTKKYKCLKRLKSILARQYPVNQH